jgi:hypothetical protein
MATVGLAEAAKMTGRNQSTIHRAMKTGRLSYTQGEAGERRIDLAELTRVFGSNGVAIAPSKTAQGSEIAALQRLLGDRDETIRDLRARLDASDEERRTVQAQLTALLTAPRPDPARRSWWKLW